MSDKSTVAVAKIIPTPTLRAHGGAYLRQLSGLQLEHALVNLPFVFERLAHWVSTVDPSLLAHTVARRNPSADVPRFRYERECQTIVLALARARCGYDDPKERRHTITRLSGIADRHLQDCIVRRRDTVRKLFAESIPGSEQWRVRGNRETSYHKLIYCLACEFFGNDTGPAANAAERISAAVTMYGGFVAPEVVREILEKGHQRPAAEQDDG